MNTQAVRNSITTRQFAENELQHTQVAVKDALNEMRKSKTLDFLLTSKIENLSDIADASKQEVIN